MRLIHLREYVCTSIEIHMYTYADLILQKLSVPSVYHTIQISAIRYLRWIFMDNNYFTIRSHTNTFYTHGCYPNITIVAYLLKFSIVNYFNFNFVFKMSHDSVLIVVSFVLFPFVNTTFRIVKHTLIKIGVISACTVCSYSIKAFILRWHAMQ